MLCLGYPGYPGPMGLQGPKGQKGECQGKGNSQHSTKRFLQNYTFPSIFFPKKIIACTQCISINFINLQQLFMQQEN